MLRKTRDFFKKHPTSARIAGGGLLAVLLFAAIFLMSPHNSVLARAIDGVQSFFGVSRPTRMFSGPNQFPPKNYFGYGIVAFNGDATSETQKRYVDICEAYFSKITSSNEGRSPPTSEQFVLVWPIDTDEGADQANNPRTSQELACEIAVVRYGEELAERALLAALAAGFDTRGREGPFLLAWVPSDTFEREDVPIVVADFSGLHDAQQYDAIFNIWKIDVLRNKEMRIDFNSWNLSRLGLEATIWANLNGGKLLQLIGVK